MTRANYEDESGVGAEQPAALFDILGDRCSRMIFLMLREKPMSAKDIASRCEASLPTVYRRVNTLNDHDLVLERTRISDDGSHYTVYENNVNELLIRLGDDGFKVDVNLKEEMSEGVAGVWDDMRDA